MESAPRVAAQRRQTTTLIIAAVLGLALVAAMITRTSQAAFTATTQNTGNFFNGGTITLTDGAASALFEVSGMEPGQSEQRCIEVTYGGTITSPQAVKVYMPAFADQQNAGTTSTGFSNYLNLTLEEGDAGSTCATFGTPATTSTAPLTVNDFGTNNTDYTTGFGAWTPTGPETRAYRVTVALDANTPDAEQGAGTTGITFAWEVQS